MIWLIFAAYVAIVATVVVLDNWRMARQLEARRQRAAAMRAENEATRERGERLGAEVPSTITAPPMFRYEHLSS